jgi:hypothetical protein
VARSGRAARARALVVVVSGIVCAGILVLASATAVGWIPWKAMLGVRFLHPTSAPAVSNLSVTTAARRLPSAALYPGGTGDVLIQIANPNPFTVEITRVTLPRSTVHATGRDTEGRGHPRPECDESPSTGVVWNGARPDANSVHALETPLVIGANGTGDNPLTVRLTDAAAMDVTAPSACESTDFQMPALVGLTVARSTSRPTASPAADRWIP